MRRRPQVISAAVLITIGAGLALISERSAAQRHPIEPPVIANMAQEEPEALAKKSGCLRCHSIDKKVVGPAFRAVAERYKGDPRARKTLFETVKNGGKGNWTELTGDVPMPPHSARLSKPDIEHLVDWVLSLKNQ